MKTKYNHVMYTCNLDLLEIRGFSAQIKCRIRAVQESLKQIQPLPNPPPFPGVTVFDDMILDHPSHI